MTTDVFRRVAVRLAAACLAVVTLHAFGDAVRAGGEPWTAAPMDWTYWRGPEQNGISREKGIVTSWSPDGENLLWKREDLAGRSTPVVMNGRLYTIVRDKPGTKFEGEKVVCVDAATGETLWENRWNVFLSDVPDTRVGWSSVVADPETGDVFALGVCGYFQRIDGETGKTVWAHSLSEEYGLLSTYGGRTNFPIVHGNLVLISAVIIGWGDMAKPAHRYIAFDKRNGQAVWFNGTRLLPYDTTYSSPILTVINGEAQMIFGSGDGGVHGFQPRTGLRIWTYNVSRRGINTTPLVVGNVVYCGHSEENIDTTAMGALFAIDASKRGDITKTGEIWRKTEWFVGRSTPLLVDGKLYAIEDKANLLIVDPKTGEKLGSKKLGTMQRASPLYVDGHIYTSTANGRWYILKPNGNSVDIVHRMRLNGEEVHGSPIVSHGRLYVPTTGALYCIGKPDHKPQADPRPDPPKESPVEDDPTPTHVQVVPVESLLRSGEKAQSQRFLVRLYNAKGQYLRTVDPSEVKFSIDGPGEIDASGKYAAPKEPVHAAVYVTARVGELTGQARIRVVPELPWEFTFDDGEVPITWVGARYRHIVIDFDLFQKLTAANPMAGQLYIFLMSEFINSGRDALRYDISTPAQKRTQLLRFVDLEDSVKNLDEAKKTTGPALDLLKQEGVLKSWEWSLPKDAPENEYALTVQRGDRGVTGNGVMVKITTIPKGTRSQAWMGHTHFHDYTIEADVMGAEKHGKLPDIGLIGQRYTIDLMGASQQLQIRTWPPQLRMAKTVSFQWKANTWYRLKMRCSVEDGKAVLRGKAWVRGTPEPKEWLVEAVDESPNVQGSPGLYGNAKDAEIFYDNIRVYYND